VPLSPENRFLEEKGTITEERSRELDPLVEYSAAHNDLPRATAQVAALLLTGNIGYPQWVAFLRLDRSAPAESRPTPADVVAALDALALTRQSEPKREFALYGDSEFRLKCLRNPWSRAKAMQLFAMQAPEGVVAPDIGQLLHTKPGDNCPICRMRTNAAERAGNGL